MTTPMLTMIMCICGYVCASLLWSAAWFLAGGFSTYVYLWATHQLKGQT